MPYPGWRLNRIKQVGSDTSEDSRRVPAGGKQNPPTEKRETSGRARRRRAIRERPSRASEDASAQRPDPRIQLGSETKPREVAGCPILSRGGRKSPTGRAGGRRAAGAETRLPGLARGHTRHPGPRSDPGSQGGGQRRPSAAQPPHACPRKAAVRPLFWAREGTGHLREGPQRGGRRRAWPGRQGRGAACTSRGAERVEAEAARTFQKQTAFGEQDGWGGGGSRWAEARHEEPALSLLPSGAKSRIKT